MDNFEYLNDDEKKKLSQQELLEYYKKLKEYYKNLKSNNISKIHKIFHPMVKAMMKTTRNFDIEIINKERLNKSCTTIYAVNHSNCHDIPTICEIVDDQFFLLLGVQKLRLIDKFVFDLNGKVMVDRKDKKSKQLAKSKLINLSLNCNDILMFPEGTWNTTENKLVLPLNWGIIDIAKVSGAVIKPINLEYIDNKCYVNIGEDIVVNLEDDKHEKIEELKNSLATLKWETLEKYSVCSRKNITNRDYEKYSSDRYCEYKPINYEYEKSVIRSKYIEEQQVFEHLKILNLNINNSFLAKSKIDYENKYL